MKKYYAYREFEDNKYNIEEETEDLKVKGTVKWFDAQKGYGFITDPEGNDVFVHHKQIKMDGFRLFHEGDIVSFELGESPKDSRIQAVNVEPILTLAMVEKALQKEHLYLQPMKNIYGNKVWLVVDVNNFIQSSERGLSLYELAAYAEIKFEEEVA